MDQTSEQGEGVPWPQRLLNSIWVLAAAAIVFFFLSYVLWGLLDLVNTGPAG